METHHFFLQLLIILISARIFSELAVYLKIPSVVGELTAGVVLGPSLLSWVEPSVAIKMLAEFGIILLLFQVGLETDVRRLASSGRKSIMVALGGFFAPLVFGYWLSAHVYGLSTLVSLFVGGTLTATSIGITVRVLSDLNKQQSNEGQIVLGAAVLDDVLGVVLLAILYEFSIGGGINVINISKIILFIAAFFILAPVAAKLISIVISRLDKVNVIGGLIPTSIVSLVLFFAWLAHAIGAPELLGGFAAGLALSRRFFLPLGVAFKSDGTFSQRIELEMKPIIQLFTPVFFVMVGLSLNLQEINWGDSFIWTFSAIFFVVAVLSKFVGVLLIKERFFIKSLIGTSMIPRGEVGIIFAELGRESGILSIEIYASLIIVIVLTTIIPPFVIKWVYERYDHYSQPIP